MASKTAASNVKTNVDALLLQKQPYFVGKPEAFQQSADVLLVLDTGVELPVRSAFLCAHSIVFCDMLTATRREEGASALRRLPLPDCTEEAVNALLLCLYAEIPSEFLSINSARAVSQLAHKFGLQGTLRMCDDFFISKGDAAPYGQWDARALWGDDLNTALEWLVWAEIYGLPQLAARAKRYALENGGNLTISACPAVNQLSSECLLWFLDARHVQRDDVQQIIGKTRSTYSSYRGRRGLPAL